MSDHQAATSTDQEPTISSDHADHEGTDLSINAAARRLGVSENAIRQRIKRETITAAKVDGVWQVFLADHEVDHQLDYQPTTTPTTTPTTSDHEVDYQANHEPIEAVYRVAQDDIRQAVAEANQRYTADMRAMFDEVGQLYQAQLAAKDQTIEAMEQTIIELRHRALAAESRLSDREAQNEVQATIEADVVLEATDAATAVPWWQLWKR